MSLNKKIQNFVIYIYIIINYLSFISYNIFEIYSRICSIYTLITFVVIIVLNLNNVYKENKKDMLILLIVSFVQIIVSTMTKTSLGSMFSNITIILGVIAFSKIDLNKKNYIFLFIITILLALRMIVIAPNSYIRYLYNPNINFNPNTIGLILMYCLIIFTYTTYKLNIKKIFSLVISIVILYGIYLTQSRTALATSIILIMFLYPFKFIWDNNKFKNIIIILTMLAILLIPFVVTYIYQNQVFEFSSNHKSLYSGRERIWQESIQLLNEEQWGWFFGIGSGAQLESYEYVNMHNMFFAIVFNFGVIVTGIMSYFFISKLLIKNKIISREREILLLCCLGIFLVGIFETSIYWPNIYCFSLMLIGQNEKYRKLERGKFING